VADDHLSGDGLPSHAISATDLRGIKLRHAIPGRVRLRIPGIKGQPALAREVQRQLAGLKVVRRVEVSPITGSVLVIYDPADTEAMMELGRMMIPGLDLRGMPANGAADSTNGAMSSPLVDAITDYFGQLNTKVGAATGSTDLKVLLPASLFLCGILRLVATKRLTTPAWYDLLWFSFGTFFTLNRPWTPDADFTDPEPEPAHVNGAPSSTERPQ
jgi:hypothetical protein